MELTIRDIVTILSIDAPIHFVSKDKMTSSDLAFCRVFGNKIADAIRAGTFNPVCSYDNTDAGLYFPDLNIVEYYNEESKRNPVAVRCNINKISEIVKVPIKEFPLFLSVYTVLHEYGHWQYYLNSKKTPAEFEDLEREARQPYESYIRKLAQMSNDDPRKYILVENFHTNIYSQFPSEKAADQYALEHIVDALDIIQRVTGYSEHGENASA